MQYKNPASYSRNREDAGFFRIRSPSALMRPGDIQCHIHIFFMHRRSGDSFIQQLFEQCLVQMHGVNHLAGSIGQMHGIGDG